MTKKLALLLSCCALILPFAANAAVGELSDSTNRPPVQVFYNPLPETDILQALTTIHGGTDNASAPSSPLYSYTYISVFIDGTVIYYDQWENGYERDVMNPVSIYSAANPLGTQIWGDGILENGCAPGTANDILYAGTVLKLESTVVVDRIGKKPYFDGGDKFGVTKPVAASRTVWASDSKTLFAGANEMYDTTYFGDEFICPIGTDTEKQNEMFQYTGLSIMAGQGGATVQISTDGKTVSRTVELGEGEAYLVDGNMKQGGYVKATSGEVQVELITGDIYEGYESRFMKLLPTKFWSTGYTCPSPTKKEVTSGKTTYTCGTKVWLYNPGDTALTVTYTYRPTSSTATALKTGTVSVPAKKAVAVVLAAKSSKTSTTDTYIGAESAAHFSADSKFYACATIDSLGTTSSTTKGFGTNRTWDWGYTLVPDNSLSTQIVIGLGLGCDPTSSSSENAAPVWVAAPEVNGSSSINASTTVYVKYDGSTTTGSKTDPNGNYYDKSFTIKPLQCVKVYNDAAATAEAKKNGQTGMCIWTLDGTKLAAAWGEDPEKATPGEPGIDMGTGIPPMPDLTATKGATLGVDADDDGYLSVGDTLDYAINIYNIGNGQITNIRVNDLMPSGLEYIPDSLTLTMKPLYGDATTTQLPNSVWADLVSSEGHTFTEMLEVDAVWTVNYSVRVVAQSSPIVNTVTVSHSAHPIPVEATSIEELRSSIGDTVFFDANGNGIQDEGDTPLAGVTVYLVDVNGNVVTDDLGRPYAQTTGADGTYLFRGVRASTYSIQVVPPEYYVPTTANAGNDDAKDSDIDPTTYKSAPFELASGVTDLTRDAGFVAVDGAASLSLVKTAGNAPDGADYQAERGDSVEYSYKVTNTGITSLRDIEITDDKIPGWTGTIAGPLAPGASATVRTTATIAGSVTNVATAVATPCGADGSSVPGIDDPDPATDDAVVVVPPPKLSDLTAAIDLVKVAGNAPDGTTLSLNEAGDVVYTYTITNVGETYLRDVKLVDDKIPGWSVDITVLAPNESTNITATVRVAADVRNTATVTGTPASEDGETLPDVVVTATDDANVHVAAPASVGDFVWRDLNGNGVQDANEPGIPNVTVKLLDADGNVVKTTTTGANGEYTFTDVVPNRSYSVEFDSLDDYDFTATGAGSSATDSDAGANGKTAVFSLSEGETRTDIDCGYVFDASGASIDIVKTAGDAEDGATLDVPAGSDVEYSYLVTNTGDTTLANITVTDDKLGKIGDIALLAPGASQTLVKTAPISLDTVNVATATGVPSDENGTPVTTATVSDSDDASVTVYEYGSIGDYVWVDADGDGVQDADEDPLAGVKVSLYDENGTFVKDTVTDANGAYLFDDLKPGRYRVVFEPKDGYNFTAKDATDDAHDSDADATGATALITVNSGDEITTVDAGYVFLTDGAAIRIVKTAGTAADGETYNTLKGSDVTWTFTVKNTGTSYLKNVTVTDDTLDYTATLDGVLAPGEVRVLTTTSAASADITNTASVEGTVTDKDGGDVSTDTVDDSDDAVVTVYEYGSIGDYVWIDADSDGVQDADEDPLPGVNVKLYDDDGLLVAETTTGENGAYLFEDLVPGDYTVVFAPVENMDFTTEGEDSVADSNGSSGTIALESGEDRTDIDAGYKLADDTASIEIVKAAGDAADGTTFRSPAGASVTYTYKVTNTGKVALKDVTVTDDKIPSLLFEIDLLAPGASKTFTAAAAISVDTVNTATATGTPSDPDGNPLSTTDVTDDDPAEVEVYELASVGDYVWVDVNGNGLQDDGEPALEGVVVTLLDADGEPVASMTTGTDGAYGFDNLEPGDYSVTFSADESLVPTVQNAGNDTLDSDIDASGATETFTLAEGATDTSRDAGFRLADNAASVSIVKLAGDAADNTDLVLGQPGQVTYTYLVTNTGSTYLANLEVTDDKIGAVGTIALLAPGASQTLAKSADIAENTVNIGTVVGTPSDARGNAWTTDTVTDDDDASVVISAEASISGVVWNDSDSDGIRDEGEMPVYNTTVELYTADGEKVGETTTDANGGYRFDGLEPGDYYVVFDPPEGSSEWSITEQDAGEDDTVDSDADPTTGRTADFTIEAGEHRDGIDCGLVGGVPSGICEWLDVATKFNAFIVGDFTANGGDSEGNLLVGGDAWLYPGYTVGLIGPGYGRTRQAAEFGTDALVVGGNLTENAYPDMNGNIVYGGVYENTYQYNYDARVYELRHVLPVTLDADWNVPEDGSGRTLESVAADVATFSAAVAALGEVGNPFYDYETNPWQPTWTASDTFRNIFVIEDETFTVSWNNSVTVTNLPAGSKVVVNILAKDVSINGGSITFLDENGSQVDPSLVLFNFPNATNIVSAGFEFFGSVLAPAAETATFSGGSIDGFAYFGGDVTGGDGFEFHDFEFRAFDCSTSDVVTQNPALRVVATANDAKDGDILTVVTGTEVAYTVIVENAGAYAIEGVTLADAFGTEYEIGDLAPLEAREIVISAAANADIDARFTATGVATSPAYEGLDVTAADTAAVCVVATQEELDAVEAAKAAALNKGHYIPRPDFEVTSIAFVGGMEPSRTNETFAIEVTVKNVGEISACPGRLGIYADHWRLVRPGETPTVYRDLYGKDNVFMVGEERTYTFTQNLVTPEHAGAFHVRALVDARGELEELSEGNNQLTVFAWLSPIALNIVAENGIVTVSWNSFEGQVYTLRTCTDLKEMAFTDYDGEIVAGQTVTIYGEDEEGNPVDVDVALDSAYRMPASVTGENEIQIPDVDGIRFFRLYAEIYNDPADVE